MRSSHQQLNNGNPNVFSLTSTSASSPLSHQRRLQNRREQEAWSTPTNLQQQPHNGRSQLTPQQIGLVASQTANFYTQEMRGMLPPSPSTTTAKVIGGGGGHVVLLPPLIANDPSSHRTPPRSLLVQQHRASSFSSSPPAAAAAQTPPRPNTTIDLQTSHLNLHQRHSHAALIEDEVRMLDTRVHHTMRKLKSILGGGGDDGDSDYNTNNVGSQGTIPRKKYSVSGGESSRGGPLSLLLSSSPSRVLLPVVGGQRKGQTPTSTNTMKSPSQKMVGDLGKKNSPTSSLSLFPAFRSLSPTLSGPPPPHPSMPLSAALTTNVDAEVLERRRLLNELNRVNATAERYALIIERNKKLQEAAEAEAERGRRGGGDDSDGDDDDGNRKATSNNSPLNLKGARSNVKRTIQSVIAEWQRVVDEQNNESNFLFANGKKGKAKGKTTTRIQGSDDLENSDSEDENDDNNESDDRKDSRAGEGRRKASRVSFASSPHNIVPRNEEEEEMVHQSRFDQLELRRINRARERMGLKPIDVRGRAASTRTTSITVMGGVEAINENSSTISAAAAAHRKMLRIKSRLQKEVDLDAEDEHVFLTGSAEEKRQRLKDIERRIVSQVLKEHLGGEIDGDNSEEEEDNDNNGGNGEEKGKENQKEGEDREGGGASKGRQAQTETSKRRDSDNNNNNKKSKDYNSTFIEFIKQQETKERNRNIMLASGGGNETGEPETVTTTIGGSPPSTLRDKKTTSIVGSSSPLSHKTRNESTVITETESSPDGGGDLSASNKKSSSALVIDIGPTFTREQLAAMKAEQRRKAQQTVELLTHRHWKLAKGHSIDVLPEPRLTAAVVTTLHGERILKELEVRRGAESVGGGGLIGTSHVKHGHTLMKKEEEERREAPTTTKTGNSSPSSPNTKNNTLLSSSSHVQTLWVRIEEGWVAAELAVPSVRSEAVTRLLREARAWKGSAMAPPTKKMGRGLLDDLNETLLVGGGRGRDLEYGGRGGGVQNYPEEASSSSSMVPPQSREHSSAAHDAIPVTFELIRQLTPLAVQPIAGISVASLLQEVVDDQGERVQRAISLCPPESLNRYEYFTSNNPLGQQQKKKVGSESENQQDKKGSGTTAAQKKRNEIAEAIAKTEREQRYKKREDELFRRQQIRDQSKGHAALIRQTWEAMGGYNPALDKDLLAKDDDDDLLPPDLPIPGSVGDVLSDHEGGGKAGGEGKGITAAARFSGPQQFSSEGVDFKSEMDDLTFAVDALKDIHVGGNSM